MLPYESSQDRYLLVARIEIVARRGRAATPSGRGPCGRRRRRGKRSPPPCLRSRRAAIDLRLRAGDERRQAIDAGAIGNHRLRLRLRLKLRLRTMIAMLAMFARLMLVARLIGLALALVIALVVVARHERLLLRRNEAGLLAEIRKALAVVVAVLRRHFVFGARLRLVLAELFLGRGDQAEIMLGVLIVVLGGTGSPEERASRASCTYFSATWEAVPRILISGPLDSNTRVIGFWPRRLLLLLLLLLLLFRLRIRLLF